MKNFKTLLLLFVFMHVFSVQGQTFQEKITKELSFKSSSNKNVLVVKNIYGNITVEGYYGNKVLLEINKTITAKAQEYIEQGRKEVFISAIDDSNKIIIYPNAPFFYFDKDYEVHYKDTKVKTPYKFNLDLVIKVPFNTNIDVRTVDGEQIIINNLKSKFIKASNIKGGIELRDVIGQTEAKTINGDITVTYREKLDVDILFSSIKGEFFAEYHEISQTTKVTKKEVKKGNNSKYVYQIDPVIHIGNGGLEYNFETSNGDVYIKKITQ